MSMKLKRLNAEWLSYVPESGRTFFYNDKNGNFQWENPLGDHNVISNSNDTNDKKNAIASFNDKFDEPIDPNHEWKAYEDPESGAVFWYNHVSKVSQWECPFEVDNNGNRRRRRNSFDSADDNDIYNVGDHETDLDI